MIVRLLRRFFMCILFMLLQISFAQSGYEKINYQAILRATNGQLLSDAEVSLRIRILNGMYPGGSEVYSEFFELVTTYNGLISIEIGGGDIEKYAEIDWGVYDLYIETAVSFYGNEGDYTVVGATEIVSVPYALHAKTSEIARSVSYENITDKPFDVYKIGDVAQGGVVFWLDETKLHGLVCTISDYYEDIITNDAAEIIKTGYQWDSVWESIGALGSGIYGGKMNTLLIRAHTLVATVPNAAQFCGNLATGISDDVSYSDWYLPSKGELEILLANISYVNTALKDGIGDTLTARYWSSTEFDDQKAWRMCVGNCANKDGDPIPSWLAKTKKGRMKLRPIRAF